MPEVYSRKADVIRDKPGMVKWFEPRQLAETGLRHVITRVFGQYADQRVMQATIDGFERKYLQDVVVKRYDYSNNPEFMNSDSVWVDFAADTGDGFDSTYAIASLIANESLEVPGAGRLPGGKILLLGGDQVYPFPTRWDYQNRFVDPFAMALPGDSSAAVAKRRMFALPGNHDWYDGLNSFDNVFCKSRYVRDDEMTRDNRIGGWVCPQHRSYWSVRLPHNWWIWGADIQLSQYLDAGQVLYFKQVAREMEKLKTDDAKLILCIAEPSWNYDQRDERQGESNLDHIINIALDHGARVCAILSGDLHHYSRYQAKELGLNLITAGGGGAYFSPTHPLQPERKLNFAGETYDLTLACKPQPDAPDAEACWPSRGQSRWLSLRILAFPFRNYGFSFALGVIYWLMAWMFSGTTVEFGPSLERKVSDLIFGEREQYAREALGARSLELQSVWDYAALTLYGGVYNPLLGMLALGILGVLIFYADGRGSMMRKVLMGVVHWGAHLTAAVCLYIALRGFSIWLPDRLVTVYAERFPPMLVPSPDILDHISRLGHYALFPLLMWFIGGLVAGAVWGLYLTVSSLLGRHCDEAFSSMRMTNFRHFLRLKIEPNRLTIYPIGLRSIPSRSNWQETKPDAAGVKSGPEFVPTKSFKPELIDGPVVIDPNTVRGRDPLKRITRTWGVRA